MASNNFSNFKNQQFVPYLLQNMPPNSSREQVIAIFKQPIMQNYFNYGNAADEGVHRYHLLMEQSRRIIQMINEEYKLHE